MNYAIFIILCTYGYGVMNSFSKYLHINILEMTTCICVCIMSLSL